LGGRSSETAGFECGSEPLNEYIRRYASQPVALIGRLAVDNQFQAKGLGSILLADACPKDSQASDVLAVAEIIVDAKDCQAASFYEHFGFIPLPGQADKMRLPASVFRLR